MFRCTGDECPDVTVHWLPRCIVCSAAAIDVQSASSPNLTDISESHLNMVIMYGLRAVSEPSSHLSFVHTAIQATVFSLQLPEIGQSQDTPRVSACYPRNQRFTPQISTWMNRLNVCLLKSFDKRESDDCLKVRVKVQTLANWFHVRYNEKKGLYLLCTVHGMYCICKDKSTRVLQEDILVWRYI